MRSQISALHYCYIYLFRYDKNVFITAYDEFLPLYDLNITQLKGGVTTPVTPPS
jgi:hypothetical protein